jgi:hypothetical protein
MSVSQGLSHVVKLFTLTSIVVLNPNTILVSSRFKRHMCVLGSISPRARLGSVSPQALFGSVFCWAFLLKESLMYTNLRLRVTCY